MSETIDVLLKSAETRLRQAGIPNPRLDAQVLLSHVLDVPREHLIRDAHLNVEAALIDAFEKLILGRLSRKPISHLTGHREFWSLDLEVTPDTLDPRPDSETVVDAALRLIPTRQAPIRILDLGTGTGALLLALLTELPQASGIGLDKSAAALEVARRNAARVHLSDRAEFLNADWGIPGWFEDLPGPFNLVVANPPYIPTAQLAALQPEIHAEPRLALDGGADGLDAYRRIVPPLPSLLIPGGGIVIEVGMAQAELVGRMMADAGFKAPGMARDLSARARALFAVL